MHHETPSALIIEGGGSHTSIGCYVDGTFTFIAHGDTSNPRSVSEGESTDTLRDLMGRASAHLPDTPVSIYAAHGAASTSHEAKQVGRAIRDCLGARAVSSIAVVNDLVPIALSDAGRNTFVAAAGTGTGYMGRSAAGRWHRASGYEFMLADEGGGFDLGMHALRAAVRHLDGRGASTVLTEHIAQRMRCAAGELRDRLFAHVYEQDGRVKAAVAAFADVVFAADSEGDAVAGTLLDAAALEIAGGIVSLETALGHDTRKSLLVLTGSLLTAQDNLRNRVLQVDGLDERFGVTPLGGGDLLEATARLAQPENDYLRELEHHPHIPAYIWRQE